MILAIDKIRTDGGTQSRAQIDGDIVEEYAHVFLTSPRFPLPPVVVFYDGKEYWLADGFHRLAAAKLAAKADLRVDVVQGTQREAILYSVGANAKHGLRRTNADKRRAVETLLRDEEWSKKSDRWIAEKCGVNHETVTRVRVATGQLAENASSSREGKDGKTRKLPTKREPAPETPPAEPHPALARQRSAPPAEMPEEPELDFEDSEPESAAVEPAQAATAPARAPAPIDDSNPYDETWIDDTIRGAMRVPPHLMNSLVTRFMSAVAARGVYLTRDER